MNAIPCKLCGSMPVVKVRKYHVCNDNLSAYYVTCYVTCSFCGNEALRHWNSENFKERHCT